MSKKQKTIQKEVSLTGVGLHTGNNVKMTFKPAPENHGFAFKRVDLEGCPTIEARAEFVVNTQRGTNLEKNGVLIQTSEHVLAAAVGLDIDNLIIEINASEPPIMDGSSKFFVKALEKGLVLNVTKDKIIRLLPPLICEKKHILSIVNIIEELIRDNYE